MKYTVFTYWINGFSDDFDHIVLQGVVSKIVLIYDWNRTVHLMFVYLVETGWMRHDGFCFIEPIHVTPGFCGKRFAMTGTATMTLIS